jgi:spore maturation protein CgeB
MVCFSFVVTLKKRTYDGLAVEQFLLSNPINHKQFISVISAMILVSDAAGSTQQAQIDLVAEAGNVPTIYTRLPMVAQPSSCTLT